MNIEVNIPTRISQDIDKNDLENIVKENNRRQHEIQAHRHCADMGVHLPSPSGIIPSYVLKRTGVVVSTDHSQVE